MLQRWTSLTMSRVPLVNTHGKAGRVHSAHVDEHRSFRQKCAPKQNTLSGVRQRHGHDVEESDGHDATRGEPRSNSADFSTTTPRLLKVKSRPNLAHLLASVLRCPPAEGASVLERGGGGVSTRGCPSGCLLRRRLAREP